MAIRPLPLFFLYLLFQFLPLLSAFNISIIITSSIESTSAESDPNPHPRFFQGVLEAIAERNKWELESIRVSKVEEARYARSRRYEFRSPVGGRDLVFRYSEKVESWRSFEGEVVEESDLAELVDSVGYVADLGLVEVEGPVELVVLGEDRSSLRLPQNTTLAGLKRILVGEGITVQITGAWEISLPCGSCSGLCNGNSGSHKGRVELLPFEDVYCIPLLPVHISGPASFVAHRTGESNSSVEAHLLSEETVELSPENWDPNYTCRELHCPISSLSSKTASMEKLLRRLLGERKHRSGEHFSSSVKANVKASTMVSFRLELERDVREDDTLWAKVAEWRTKPNLERVRFDVMARLDGDRLHPLKIKNVRSLIGVDTAAWSSILMNVSLTKFPAFLIPPQALTLDVKW